MDKEAFFALLEDQDVQQKIISLLDKEVFFTLLEDADVQQKMVALLHASEDNIANSHQEELVKLQQQLQACEQEKDEMRKLIEKLKKIFGLKEAELAQQQEQNSSLNVKIETFIAKEDGLEQELQASTSSHASLQRELQQKSSEHAALAKDFEKSSAVQKKLQKKLDFYRTTFEQDMVAYETYQALSPETTAALKNIFKSNTLNGFLACGVQERNIQNLWEYIKTELLEDRNHADVQRLNAMFSFFFARFTLAFDMYARMDSQTGERFDTQLHIRHHQSAQSSGVISQVYLQGYQNSKTNKIIKQSIVRVG